MVIQKMEKDKMELLLAGVFAMVFAVCGTIVFVFVDKTFGYTLIGISVSIISSVLTINIIFNSIPTWRLNREERTSALIIRAKQFEQKEGFIKQLTTKPSEEDKEEVKDIINEIKEKGGTIVKELISNLKSSPEPPKV